MARRKKPFIPAQRKETMRRRAEAAATRQHAPLLQAAQGGVRQANREFRREKQSVIGADTMLQQSMNRSLAGTQKSGLTGRYKQQTLAELRAIKAGSKAAIPGLLADASAARRDAVAEARSSVATEAAKRDETAAKKYNTLLNSAISRKATAVKEKREKAGKPKLNRSAVIAAKIAMKDWAENKPIKDSYGNVIGRPQKMNPLKTPDDWRRAAASLRKQFTGFDLSEALKALAVERKRLEARRAKTRAGFEELNRKYQSGGGEVRLAR